MISSELGEKRGLDALRAKLEAGDVRNANDGCRASCVDWYGNARPIFARDRVFALLGYELVEGQVLNAGIREVRPGARLGARLEDPELKVLVSRKIETGGAQGGDYRAPPGPKIAPRQGPV